MTKDEIQAEIDAAEQTTVAVIDLLPADTNPRRNTDAAGVLAGAVQEVGWGAPVLIQKSSGKLIAGHTRHKAALQLGLERVPALVLDVDDRRAKALQLADNRLGELAAWDWPGLAEDLSAFGLEEVEAFGFDSKYLEDLADKVDGFGPLDITEDEVPDPPKDPVTKPGDVWVLGEHRVVCGDCTKAFPSDAALDIVVTDPPYGVDHVGGTKDPRSPKYRSGKAVHNDGADQIQEVGIAGLDAVFAAARPGACFYIAAPPGPLLAHFITWANGVGVLRQCLVWVKDSFVFGRSEYHYKHEMLLFGWKPGAAHHASKDRSQDSVWEFDRPKASPGHPTMKPVGLFARAINNSSKSGDTVGDPFLGSGTTLIAAEQLGRRCVGTEIDPGYCDVIVERWGNLTGKSATRG